MLNDAFTSADDPDLKVGGKSSGGSRGGRGSPDMAMSIKCMAKINSSAVSFPS